MSGDFPTFAPRMRMRFGLCANARTQSERGHDPREPLHITHDSHNRSERWQLGPSQLDMLSQWGSGLASFAGHRLANDTTGGALVHPDRKQPPLPQGNTQCWKNPGATTCEMTGGISAGEAGACLPEIDPVPRPSRGQAGHTRRRSTPGRLEYFAGPVRKTRGCGLCRGT